jgi:hypothetical protein
MRTEVRESVAERRASPRKGLSFTNAVITNAVIKNGVSYEIPYKR